MRNIVTLATKEIRSLFVSPTAYVVLTGYLLLGGWLFFNLLFQFDTLITPYAKSQNPQDLQMINLNDRIIAPLLHDLIILLIIMVPFITMRSFAEEKKNGTYELLMTSPLTVLELVLGKYLGCLFFLFIMILAAGIYPSILLIYGNPEVGALVAGYMGLFLIGAVFVAVGIFTSSLTENQIIAAVTCFVILLLLYVISWPAVASLTVAGELLKYLSIVEHFSVMLQGLVDTRDIFYFLTLIVLCIFLTQRAVESSRWK